jgi:uncharacterized membrane protein
MIKVENSIIVQKPVETVFAFAVNPENATKWQGGVESVKSQSSTPMVGQRHTEVRKFMGRDMETTLEISALKSNEIFSLKTLNGPVPYEVTVIFEPVEGGTRMTTKIQAEPGGFFKLAEGMVSKQLEKSVQEDNQRLKSLMEGS